jgi:hypothetical protein
MRSTCRLSAALAVSLGLSVGFAEAGVILSPAAVIASSLGSLAGTTHTNAINGSGLPPFTSGVTDYADYLATAPGHDAFNLINNWFGLGSLPGSIDYDLGGLFLIEHLVLWNDGTVLDINSFTVFTSLDASFATAVDAGTFSASNTAFASSVALIPSVAQFVRLRINSTYGSSFTALGEIAVDATEVSQVPVPEPSSLALLSLGLAAAARARRRARPSTSRADGPPHRR